MSKNTTRSGDRSPIPVGSKKNLEEKKPASNKDKDTTKGPLKSISPSRFGSLSLSKASMANKDDKNSSVVETYSKLDKLLQDLKVNTVSTVRRSGKSESEDEEEQQGLFNQSENSESSSTSHTINKSYAKNLMGLNTNL